MAKALIVLVAVLMTSTMMAPAIFAEETREPTEEEMKELNAEREARIADFYAQVDAPATIDAARAAEILVAQAMGEVVEEADLWELAKFMRDASAPTTDKAMSDALAQDVALGYLGANGLDIARDLIADDGGFQALLDEGAFDGKTFEEVVLLLAPLGIDEDGVDRNSDVIAAFQGTDLSPSFQLDGPWGQEYWDTLGVTATLVQLALAATLPAGGSNFLPHNIRVNIAYIAARLTAGSAGSWTNGYVWAQLDVDDLLGVAFDIRANTDTIALQLPLSIRVELHWRLVCPWFCYLIFWVEVHLPQTVMATNPVWEFAVPAMAGGPATRAESSDILMVVYDRLGNINTQKAREGTSAPYNPPAGPGLPAHPGLGDLGTQSPIVNYYGLQGDFSKVPPLPALPGTPVDGQIPPIHKRQRGDFATPGDSTGTTLGYAADTVRAWTLNVMAVRVNTAGTGTANLGEPPASLYYESTSNIFTGSGLMYKSDYSVKNDVKL